MQRGLRNAKTPNQVKEEKNSAAKDLAVAVAKIIGIGLVAGTALVVGTNRVMKKLFGKNGQAQVEADEKEALEEADE